MTLQLLIYDLHSYKLDTQTQTKSQLIPSSEQLLKVDTKLEYTLPISGW